MTITKRALIAGAIGAMGALSALASSEMSVKVEQLHPFAHVASIPEGADLSSIKLERIKLVNVASERTTVTNGRACSEAANRDGGGSVGCLHSQTHSTVPAYQVTYSYRAEPLASDEYGSRYFTFSVYFRQDEISAAVRQRLSAHLTGAAASDFFLLTTHRDVVPRVVLDEQASRFCEGNFVEGSWKRSDPQCGDKIYTKTITSLSNNITVKVDAASADVATNPSR